MPKITVSQKETSRSSVAHDLIRSFETIKSVNGYKDDRRHISPALAAELLTLNYKGQRNLRQDMVKILTGAMTSKKNYSPNNVVAISYNPDRPTDTSMIVLLNAQHTLHAIIASNTSWPLMVSLFPCRSKADIEFHYSLFDQGRNRNQVDVSRAIGLLDAIKQHNLPQQAVAALGSAAKLIRAHLIDSREGGRDKMGNARLIRDWIDEAAVVYRLISTPDRRKGHSAVRLDPITEIGKMFRKRLASPLLLPSALVALRSHPDETEEILRHLIAVADGHHDDDEFGLDIINYLIEAPLSSGSDRRIASRNFIFLMTALRARLRTGQPAPPIKNILIDCTPNMTESEALWDILTEDRLDRSVAHV